MTDTGVPAPLSGGPQRLYLEPTSRCNLHCPMCPRSTWEDQATGDMAPEVFDALLHQARGLESLETIFFGGIAEPLTHPGILDMLVRAAGTGRETELITNGTLLDEERIEELLRAGIGRLWVSIDRPHREGGPAAQGSPARIRRALKHFNAQRGKLQPSARLGIAFVAMKSNIRELPALLELGHSLEVSEIRISNVIPHTPAMREELLYGKTLARDLGREESGQPWPRPQTRIRMSVMDFDTLPGDVLRSLLSPARSLQLGRHPVARETDHCRFIHDGSVFVRWDGAVCPCPALLHTHTTYLQETGRRVAAHSFGNIRQTTLGEIWDSPVYRDFRERVRRFAFSPCTTCGLCEEAAENQADCYNNPAPVCGACLWAQGYAQCP